MKRFLIFSLVFCLSFISICSPCYAKEKEEDVEYHFEIKRYQSFPEKYQKAVQLADIYANFVHHSKEGTIWVLRNIEDLDNDEIVYGISHIQVDWKKNALWTAKMLKEELLKEKKQVKKEIEKGNAKESELKKYSKKNIPIKIYDELIHPFWGVFTKEEAQYAIRNLNKCQDTDNEKWWIDFSSDEFE